VTYYYVVAGVNSLGDGTNSAEVSVTPSLSSSLAAWFKADAISGLNNGAAVSDWPDLSGNGDDAVQTNAASRPKFVTSALNGMPVVRFNAATSNWLAFARPVQDDFTIFCLFRSLQGLGSGTLYYQGAGLVNGEMAGVTTDFGSCLFANGTVCAGTGNPDVAANSAPGFNDGNPHLMTFKRIESTGEVDLYVDGLLVASTNGNTSSLQAPGRLVLGAQQTMNNFLSGDIAEVKIFNSALPDSERISQENVLLYKWGLRTRPALAASAATAGAGAFSLGWPASASGWQLYATTSLAPPTVWFPVTNAVSSNSGLFSLTVPLDSGSKFFRLSAP
jgi:hypothetical protein